MQVTCVFNIKAHAAFPQLLMLPGPACLACVHSGTSVYVICASLCQGEQPRPGSGAVPADRPRDEG